MTTMTTMLRRSLVHVKPSRLLIRTFAGPPSPNPPPQNQPLIFDDNVKNLQRENATRIANATANSIESSSEAVDYTYFHTEISNRLIDRLEDIKSRSFELALSLGSSPNSPILQSLTRDESLCGNGGGIGGVKKLVIMDGSQVVLDSTRPYNEENKDLVSTFKLKHSPSSYPYPFPSNSFDLIISSLHLHTLNDLPSTLFEINRLLHPDGLLLLSIPGGQTLPELRSCLLLSEMERKGGQSPHVGPFVDLPDLGKLLTGAGFQLPTVDVDNVTIEYPNAFVLMEHLGRMGEGNAIVGDRGEGRASSSSSLGLDAMLGAAAVYQSCYKAEGMEMTYEDENEDELTESEKENEARGIVATSQVLYAIGWKHHESQQQADVRGSGGGRIGSVVDDCEVVVDKTEKGKK